MKTSVRAAVEVMFQRRRQCLTAGQVLINLRLLSQVRRRRVAAWTRLCPAGALAIGGFVRSRWRGGRGGAMGFACAIRDLFVAGLG
jgi:hypothetical protein